MNYKGNDVRELVIERIFPELRYGEDPDIERYFELRSQGRMLDALIIYRRKLIPRYPDDESRVLLLKLYRTRSSSYPDFLRSLLFARADNMIARIKSNIDSLLLPLSGVSLKNTYAVLKAVERIARLLPDEEDAARSMAENYSDFALILDHRKKEADQLCFLLGEFFDQASIEENTPADFIASSIALEEEKKRKSKEEAKKNFFDLGKIEFDKSDIARIEIPANLVRDEDKVLAYCHKYWIRTEDSAFERIIWLYSKKYGTRHYEVFRTIKAGRRKKYPDGDILTMVSTTIASRYNYSVQGDLYMQAAWRSIKASIYGQFGQAAAKQAEPAQKAAPVKTLKHKTSAKKPAKTHSKPTLVRAEKSRGLSPAPKTPEAVPEIRPKGSISDKIKYLSGKGYDVYRDVFLASLRPSIRETLSAGKSKSPAISREDINKAENLVFDFMEKNYSNAYMDWLSSADKLEVRKLGFELDSLDDIIENCYKKIES
ncbi:hypothetical protein MASR2M29_00870 [Spirochaetota bacterium]